MRNPNNRPDLALALLASASFPLSLAGPAPLRASVLGALVLFGPGGAAALWFWRSSPGRRSRLAMGAAFHIALAIGLSLAVSLLVATGMVYAHLWNPAAGMWVVAAVTLALLAGPRLSKPLDHQPSNGRSPAKVVPDDGI